MIAWPSHFGVTQSELVEISRSLLECVLKNLSPPHFLNTFANTSSILIVFLLHLKSLHPMLDCKSWKHSVHLISSTSSTGNPFELQFPKWSLSQPILRILHNFECRQKISHTPGLRTFHLDRHPSHATGRLRNWTRLHVRHPQTAADDHFRSGQGADSDLPQLTGRTAQRAGSTHERHRLRGDRPELLDPWRLFWEGTFRFRMFYTLLFCHSFDLLLNPFTERLSVGFSLTAWVLSKNLGMPI